MMALAKKQSVDEFNWLEMMFKAEKKISFHEERHSITLQSHVTSLPAGFLVCESSCQMSNKHEELEPRFLRKDSSLLFVLLPGDIRDGHL